MKTVWVRGLRAERGFTLVELLVTSAMTLVVFASMFGAMIAQQQSYSLQIDSSEASQNARAALSIIKHELRMAGWGLSSSTQANFPAVGTCNNDVDRFACNDLADFGSGSRTSDRMRIVSMVPGPFDRGAEWNAPTLSTFKTADYPALADTPVMENNTLAFIDGECAATSESYVAMVEITSTSSGTTTGFHRDYAVTDPPPGSDYSTDYPTRSGCAGVLGPEVKVSLARVVDFYIDRTEDVPRLMMNVNPEGTFDAGSTPDDDVVVAYNIDSLQIEYGVDVGSDLATTPSDVPDQEADIWCADLTDTLCDTNSILASGLTPAQRAARVVAVRIAVVPRAETTSLDEGEINPDFTVMSSLIPGDRFRRWVFRGGVRLRNNEL